LHGWGESGEAILNETEFKQFQLIASMIFGQERSAVVFGRSLNIFREDSSAPLETKIGP